MTSAVTPTSERTLRSRVGWSTDIAASLAAGVCALLTWLAVAKAVDVDLAVGSGSQVRHIGGVAVVVTAVVVALAGFILLRVLERTTTRALRIWTIIAVAVWLLSLLGPLGATTRDATFALLSLHAVVAAVVIAAGRRSRR